MPAQAHGGPVGGGQFGEAALGRLFTVAARLAAERGIAESGYLLMVACNRDGGQEVYHLHMHLLGGRRLRPSLASV